MREVGTKYIKKLVKNSEILFRRQWPGWRKFLEQV